MKRRYVKHTPHQHTTLPSARASVRRRLRQVAYTGLRLPPLGRAKTCNSKWSGRQRETSCFCSQWLPQPWLQGPFAHRTLFTPPHLHASWFAMVVLYSPTLSAASQAPPARQPSCRGPRGTHYSKRRCVQMMSVLVMRITASTLAPPPTPPLHKAGCLHWLAASTAWQS